MDLTSQQKINLVAAVKAYEAAKRGVEVASKNLATKLDKLRECAQASGPEQQVMEKVHQVLAKAYMEMPQDPGEV